MTRTVAIALLLWGVFLLTRCKSEAGHQDELGDRIKEFQTIRENTYLSRSERSRAADLLAKKLTRLYPGALPIGQDSARKIFRSRLPDTISIFRRVDQNITYVSPPHGLDSLVTYPQKKYFSGIASYGLFRGKSQIPRQGILITVEDQGYSAEWFGKAVQDLKLKGQSRGGLEAMMRSHEFMQDIEYAGQKWAVWYDQTRSHPAHQGSRMFITQWNHRFSIAATTTDTSVHRPDFAGRVIDFDWLNQLKYRSK